MLAGCQESGVAKKTSILDGGEDSNEILHHNAACAQVQVPDLAVAHLPTGKANPDARCFEERAGRMLPDGVPGWCARERDGVSFFLRPVAPSVENDESNGARRIDGHICPEGVSVYVRNLNVQIYPAITRCEPLFSLSCSSLQPLRPRRTHHHTWQRSPRRFVPHQ